MVSGFAGNDGQFRGGITYSDQRGTDQPLSYSLQGHRVQSSGSRAETFLHVERQVDGIFGYEPSDGTQIVAWGGWVNSLNDVPGRVTATTAGDGDDTNGYQIHNAGFVARRRLGEQTTATGKVTFGRVHSDFRNPGSFTPTDGKHVKRLHDDEQAYSAEIRLDVDGDNDVNLRAGYSHAWLRLSRNGNLGRFHPVTGKAFRRQLHERVRPDGQTFWGEIEKVVNDQVSVSLGGY